MKDTILIKVTPDVARTFMRHMGTQGYVAHEVASRGVTDVHFTLDGVTTADNSVTIMEDEAFIGIRPR